MSPADLHRVRRRPHIKLGAVLAVLFAAGGMIASLSGHAVLGLILALVAGLLGAAGVVGGDSPRSRGGVANVLALSLAAIAIVVAVLSLVFDIVLFRFP